MKINYTLIRLHILILSPIFPSLLTIILIMVYKIYFETPILCDNDCSPLLLDQLKQNFDQELEKSSNIGTNIREFSEIIEETNKMYGAPNSDQITYNDKKLMKLQKLLIKSLSKAKEIEYSIKKIDPNYVSGAEDFITDTIRALQQNTGR